MRWRSVNCLVPQINILIYIDGHKCCRNKTYNGSKSCAICKDMNKLKILPKNQFLYELWHRLMIKIKAKANLGGRYMYFSPEPYFCVYSAIFFPRVILYNFFLLLLIYGGLGFLFKAFSWWDLVPVVWGLLGFLGLGSLYKHKRITLGKKLVRL